MRKFMFTFITLAILYGIAEVCAYWWIKHYSDTGFYGNRPLVNTFDWIGWRTPSYADIGGIKTDGKGRSKTYTNGDKVLVITGGSGTFGVGQSCNEKTVPSQLGRLLGMKAVNLSVKAYRSFQEMLILREYFLEEKADIVISITGLVDSMYADSEPDLPLLPADVLKKIEFVNRAEQEFPIWQNVDGYARQFSYSADLFCRFVRKLIRKPGLQPVAQRRFELIPLQVSRVIDHWHMMKTLCERHGVQYYVVLQPIRTDRPFLSQFYDELMRQGWGMIDMNLKDFLPSVDFVDSAHLTDEGARKVAERIAEIIREVER